MMLFEVSTRLGSYEQERDPATQLPPGICPPTSFRDECVDVAESFYTVTFGYTNKGIRKRSWRLSDTDATELESNSRELAVDLLTVRLYPHLQQQITNEWHTKENADVLYGRPTRSPIHA